MGDAGSYWLCPINRTPFDHSDWSRFFGGKFVIDAFTRIMFVAEKSASLVQRWLFIRRRVH